MDADHNYRVYLLGTDGHIVERVDLECDDDDTAKVRAEALLEDGHDVELWDGARKIAEFRIKRYRFI